MSAECLFVLCGCRRTAGTSRSEQVANSSNPAPDAAFGQETLGAFAGLTAFYWLLSVTKGPEFAASI